MTIRGGPRGRRGRGRGRGNRGRGRGRGRTSQTTGATGSGKIDVIDTEYITWADGKAYAWTFNPAADGLTRLMALEKAYTRFRVNSATITWKPAAAMTQSQVIYFGILPGKATEQNKDNIMKVRPARMTPCWKGASIQLGRLIDSSRFMKCGDNTEDGVSFTLLAATSDNSAPLGAFQVSYNVELSFPRPFT